MKFYVGLHQRANARHFGRCMININRLRGKKSGFPVGEWMMDSGAFMELLQHGRYRHSPEEYAREIIRWWSNGLLVAAVSQDYMCEPLILEKTGLSVPEHQRLTIERYDVIRPLAWPLVYVLPVLQGYEPEEYVSHIRQYGGRLGEGQWVGVGSVCKRNANVDEIEHVLMAIKDERPDLRLHEFGVKLTALASSVVRSCLYSADSMAWSYSARKQGRDGNNWREAERFVARIESQVVQERTYQRRLF